MTRNASAIAKTVGIYRTGVCGCEDVWDGDSLARYATVAQAAAALDRLQDAEQAWAQQRQFRTVANLVIR